MSVVARWWWLAIIALPLLAAYLVTVSAYPQLEDDALFILASYFAGTAHSPGYPAYVLLTQPFQWLPFGTVALKVHLVNVCLAIGLCILLAVWLERGLKIDRVLAVTATLCLGFSTLFWEQALLAEAYMLNAFFFLALLVMAWKVSERPVSSMSIFLFGLLFGASLANHWPLTLLVSPVYLAILIPVFTLCLRNAHWGMLGLGVGLLPYAWMIMRTHSSAFTHMGPIETLDQFIYFVSRDVYTETDQNELASIADKWLFARLYLEEIHQQMGWLVTAIVVAGFIVQWRILAGRLAVGLTLCLLLPGVLVILLDFTYTRLEIESMRVYPLPLYIVLAIWGAIGLRYLFERILRDGGEVVRIVVALIVVLSVLIPNLQVQKGEEKGLAVSHAQSALQRVPRDAVFFVMDDWLMGIISYLHLVEGVRPDIQLYSEYATFLPDRLFPYFGLTQAEKDARLNTFARETDRPLAVLQRPERFGMSYKREDRGYFYEKGLAAPDVVVPFDLLNEEPLGSWNNLHWRYLIRRFDLVNKQLEGTTLDSNFVVNLNRARKALSRSGQVATSKVVDFLARAEASLASRDRLDQADYRFLQARLLHGTGQLDAALPLYELSASLYRSRLNPAVSTLEELRVQHSAR